ncbi:hypothetical protein DVH05_006570 [Phytophthora capsici]|nr:hypothetical protein DVH05_006570 [Phytophthora capsici]
MNGETAQGHSLTLPLSTPESDACASYAGGVCGHEKERQDEGRYGQGSASFACSDFEDESFASGTSGEVSDSKECASQLDRIRSQEGDEGESPKKRPLGRALPEDTPSKSKRKKFTKTDDVALLRQVQAELPFKAAKGGVMASWDALANNLKTLKDFSKEDTITGKSAQARFNTLVASHRKFDKKSERASGIDQRYAEKRQLLDDLVSQCDEHDREEARRSRERKDKLAAEDNAGKVMRDAGLKRMKDRKKEDEGQAEADKSAKRYKPSVIDLIREDMQVEREEKAKRWEADNADKLKQREEEREERHAERKLRLQLAQMEHERVRMENERLDKMLKLAQLQSQRNPSPARRGEDC